MRRSPWFLPLLALTCAAAPGRGADEVSPLLDAVDHLSDPQVLTVLIAGLGDAGIGGPTCARHLGSVAAVDPQERARATRRVLRHCPVCVPASNRDTLAPDAITRVLQRCDAAGPDPVFGGELAASRVEMRPGDYLITRMLVEQVWAAYGRASPQGAQIDALRPRLARILAAEHGR